MLSYPGTTRDYRHLNSGLVAKNKWKKPICSGHDGQLMQAYMSSAPFEEKRSATHLHVLQTLHHTIGDICLPISIKWHTSSG